MESLAEKSLAPSVAGSIPITPPMVRPEQVPVADLHIDQGPLRLSWQYRAILSGVFLAVTDLTVLLICWMLGVGARGILKSFLPRAIHNVPLASPLDLWWIPTIYFFFFAYERLYEKRFPFWDEPREIIKALSIATIVILSIVTLGKMQDRVSRLIVLFLLGFGIFLIPLFRILVKRALYSVGIWQEDVLVLGAGEAGVEAARGLIRDRHQGYRVVGFLDDSAEKIGKTVLVEGQGIKIFSGIQNFPKISRKLGISTAVIAIPSLSARRLSHLSNEVHKHVRSILVVPDLKGSSLLNTELFHLFREQIYLINIRNNLKYPVNRSIKFLFDLLACLLMLPLLFVVILVIGLAIRLETRGPVFYFHERVGRKGLKFRIWKFRTMYLDAEDRIKTLLKKDPAAREEWDRTFKLKNDPRITRVGRFLRETSLDELPQIINVVAGQMSLVGPRPVLQVELDRYYKERSDYYAMVRPGITGLWQVSGRSNTTYEYRVWLDCWYVINWSIWFDIIILLKTIGCILRRDGAF